MNRARNISLETLDIHNDYGYDYNYSGVSKDLDHLNISLEDLYDTISLYDQDDNESVNTKRLTWEEWYLKKKIENLKNEKELKRKISKKLDDDQKPKKYPDEKKEELLEKWLAEKRRHKKELEARLAIILEEKEKREREKLRKKEKGESEYNKWLLELKEKEKARKKEEENKLKKQKADEEHKKKIREENLKNMQKKESKVRRLNEREGKAMANGKIYTYYDWSTSPEPSYINKKTWIS